MEPAISPLLFAVLLFGGMLILLEIGRRLGIRRRLRESEGERGSLGTIEGAMFALFGLVVAFTFSGAASRFNEKRVLYRLPRKLMLSKLLICDSSCCRPERGLGFKSCFASMLTLDWRLIGSCQTWRQQKRK